MQKICLLAFTTIAKFSGMQIFIYLPITENELAPTYIFIIRSALDVPSERYKFVYGSEEPYIFLSK